MRYFETVIRVPMPEGSLAWGKIAAAIEPVFEALAKGLVKAGVEGVEIVQREVRKSGPRQKKVVEMTLEQETVLDNALVAMYANERAA